MVLFTSFYSVKVLFSWVNYLHVARKKGQGSVLIFWIKVNFLSNCWEKWGVKRTNWTLGSCRPSSLLSCLLRCHLCKGHKKNKLVLISTASLTSGDMERPQDIKNIIFPFLLFELQSFVEAMRDQISENEWAAVLLSMVEFNGNAFLISGTLFFISSHTC